MLVSYFALLLLNITFICYTIPYLLQFEAIKGGIKRLSDIVRTIRHLLYSCRWRCFTYQIISVYFWFYHSVHIFVFHPLFPKMRLTPRGHMSSRICITFNIHTLIHTVLFNWKSSHTTYWYKDNIYVFVRRWRLLLCLVCCLITNCRYL